MPPPPTDGRQSCVCVFLQKANWAGSTGLGNTVHQSIWQSSLRGQYYNIRIRWAWFGSVVFLFFSLQTKRMQLAAVTHLDCPVALLFLFAAAAALPRYRWIQSNAWCASWILAGLCSIDHTSALKTTMLHHLEYLRH